MRTETYYVAALPEADFLGNAISSTGAGWWTGKEWSHDESDALHLSDEIAAFKMRSEAEAELAAGNPPMHAVVIHQTSHSESGTLAKVRLP